MILTENASWVCQGKKEVARNAIVCAGFSCSFLEHGSKAALQTFATQNQLATDSNQNISDIMVTLKPTKSGKQLFETQIAVQQTTNIRHPVTDQNFRQYLTTSLAKIQLQRTTQLKTFVIFQTEVKKLAVRFEKRSSRLLVRGPSS